MNELKELYDAWKGLDDIMVEHGMDKKAQPEEAQKWLQDRLGELALRKRQVEVLVDECCHGLYVCPSAVRNCADYDGDCVKCWSAWSLEQAKKGMK